MSAQTVESILSRAMSDPAFADLLFTDAAKALEGAELTAEEASSLNGLSRAQFQTMSPEDRKSFCMSNHNETTLIL